MLNKKGLAPDDFIPFLFVLVASVFFLVFMVANNVLHANSVSEEVNEIKTGISSIRALNNYLDNEVVYKGEKMRRIDMMAIMDDDEDEIIEEIKEEISGLLDPIQKEWWFELRNGEEKILSTGSGVPIPKQIGKFEGCTLPYLFGKEKLFDTEYRVDLPQGGRLLLCY
ncbi:MAG: hypothetical protein KAT77_02105 [Nanoarchaeota archaeon]|nr:hypothetical protein [Nanoarchaeota archaeon]